MTKENSLHLKSSPISTRPLPLWLSAVHRARLMGQPSRYCSCADHECSKPNNNNNRTSLIRRNLFRILGLTLVMGLVPSSLLGPPGTSSFYYVATAPNNDRTLVTLKAMETKPTTTTVADQQEQSLIQQQQQTGPPRILSYPDANMTRPDEKNKRPYFIFHVGPPKSATTTLQTEMTKYREQLLLDNYRYLGQRMINDNNMWEHIHGHLLDTLKDLRCQRQVSRARVTGTEWPPCWKEFLDYLARRRQEGRNIILSEENFSIKYMDLGPQLGRTSLDWLALKMVLQEQGWEPIVIVGYRRLYDIMPSAKQQWDRWTKANTKVRVWPPEGRTLEPLFPQVLKDPHLYDNYVPRSIPYTVQWSYTDHLIKMISPFFPVRLLNMHDPLSIRSTFLCRVLPYAPNACRESQIDDAKQQEVRRNSEESLFYDAISTEAARRDWFDADSFDRHVIALAVKDYYEDELKRNPMDLPLMCPNNTELEILLERSLVKEERIFSEEVAKSMRNEHIAGFWEAVKKKKFCWIDVAKTLEEKHWRQFFSELVPWDSSGSEDNNASAETSR